MSLYRIRPLVWENHYSCGVKAETILGTINAWPDSSGKNFSFELAPTFRTRFKTLESAKLAAESHYHDRLTGDGGCLELFTPQEQTP